MAQNLSTPASAADAANLNPNAGAPGLRNDQPPVVPDEIRDAVYIPRETGQSRMDERDPQQVMDDSQSQYETGDVEAESQPRDIERMKLGKIPNSKRN